MKGMVEFPLIQEAWRRLTPHLHLTPILTSRSLDQALGKTLFFKAEHLQKTGSFKARGALNKALRLEAPKGLLAFSSGNHAQGVAYAAHILGLPALVVMPEGASPAKKAATLAYGAQVYDQGVTPENREAIAQALAQETGYALVHPFDDPLVVAGQGTVGLELLLQLGREGLEAILVPVGGGGLLAGVALAVKTLAPWVRVYGAEPRGQGDEDDARQSLERGEILRLPHPPRTRADGARTLALGETPFAVIRRHVDGILPVREEALLEAEALLFTRLKQAVEPTGALGLAAVLEHSKALPQRLAIVLSGGNAPFRDV